MHPLKAARKAIGLSLCQVAIKLGLPGNPKQQASQVCSWENGTNVPRSDRAEKLAAHLGFQSGEMVQELCREWKKEHIPRKEKPKKKRLGKVTKKQWSDPYNTNERMHPLKEYRRICWLTQAELAEKMGFENVKQGRTRISRWENGENIPGYERAKRLARILGFSSAEEVLQKCQAWRDQEKEEKSKREGGT